MPSTSVVARTMRCTLGLAVVVVLLGVGMSADALPQSEFREALTGFPTIGGAMPFRMDFSLHHEGDFAGNSSWAEHLDLFPIKLHECMKLAPDSLQRLSFSLGRGRWQGALCVGISFVVAHRVGQTSGVPTYYQFQWVPYCSLSLTIKGTNTQSSRGVTLGVAWRTV